MVFAGSVATFVKRNGELLLEGAFWGSWCGLNVFNWSMAHQDRMRAEFLPEDANKAQLVWQAQKDYILSSFSLVSGISMVTSFLEDSHIVSFGPFGPLMASLGFGGSAIVSSSKLWDNLYELAEQNQQLSRAQGLKERARIGFTQLETLIRVAFYATVAAWGVLGAAHALVGGAVLFSAMDTALYLAVLQFGVYLISSVALPVIKQRI